MLQSHIDRFTLAQRLRTENIFKVSVAQRKEATEAVHDGSFVWSLPARMNLIAVTSAEERDVKKLVQQLQPARVT